MDNEFDDLFKERFRQYEGDVPADMWQRIIAGKKKRRGAYIWSRYLIALALLLFVMGIYQFYHQWNKTNAGNDIINEAKNKVQPLDTANDTSNANEEALLPGIDKTAPVAFSKKLNADHNPGRSVFSKNLIIENNNNSQILNGDHTEELPHQERSDLIISNNADSIAIKKSIQKKSATGQITTDDSERDSTKEDEDPDKISLQFFASPDIPFSSIHSSNSEYQKLLQNTINMRLSYTFGIGISIAVSKKISLSSGVQYSRVNENISFGDSVQTMHNSINHFNFINVPLIISYKTAWTSSFQTSLKAGILLNISSKYKGFIPDAYNQLTDISHGIYERNTGVSIYTAINFSKPVNNKLDVFAEPYFRYQTKNIAENLQPFTRRIHTAGLALGVQFKLFKDTEK